MGRQPGRVEEGAVLTLIEVARYHFLDASALVTLLLHPGGIIEPGCEVLTEYRRNNQAFYTNNLCLAETFSILKVKHFGTGKRRQISLDGYLCVANLLTTMVEHRTLHIIDDDLSNRAFFNRAEEIVRKHKIDLIDAMQIVSIKHGKYSSLTGKSVSMLITADSALAKAARAEDIEVWDVVHEPVPAQPTHNFKSEET